MQRKKIEYIGAGAKRVHPEENRVELEDGSSVAYDYLVIATGPDLAFDEIEGLGPEANTQSICHVDHAARAYDAFEEFVENPARSSSAPCRARPASARPTNSPSSSKPSCAAARSATRCR